MKTAVNERASELLDSVVPTCVGFELGDLPAHVVPDCTPDEVLVVTSLAVEAAIAETSVVRRVHVGFDELEIVGASPGEHGPAKGDFLVIRVRATAGLRVVPRGNAGTTLVHRVRELNGFVQIEQRHHGVSIAVFVPATRVEPEFPRVAVIQHGRSRSPCGGRVAVGPRL